MLSRPPFKQTQEDQVLSLSLFFSHCLLVYVLCDPTVGMTEQLPRRFNVYPLLPQHRGQSK